MVTLLVTRAMEYVLVASCTDRGGSRRQSLTYGCIEHVFPHAHIIQVSADRFCRLMVIHF